jgi:hypothetical protein
MCHPTKLGGLSVMHLEKYAMALRLRWSWLKWTSPNKIWVGNGNPCSKEDMDFLYATTTITMETSARAPFGILLGLVEVSPLILRHSFFIYPKGNIERCGNTLRDDAWVADVYARFYPCRQCWASKYRGL